MAFFICVERIWLNGFVGAGSDANLWFRALALGALLSLLWTAYRIRLRAVERHQGEISALNE